MDVVDSFMMVLRIAMQDSVTDVAANSNEPVVSINATFSKKRLAQALRATNAGSWS